MSKANDDKTIIKAGAAEKANLNAGADVTVPTGQEPVPPARVDPADGRKALFNKAREIRENRITNDRSDNPGVDDLANAVSDAASVNGSGNELRRHSVVDTEAGGRGQPATQPRAPVTPAVTHTPIPAEAIDTATGRVNVRVNGKVISVPAEDVTRAGGVEAYQKNRAATIKLAEATAKEKALEEREARLARFEEDSRARHGGAQAPASPSPGPAAPGTVPSATDEQGDAARVQSEAEAIITDLYSGDKKRGIAAIAQLIQNSRVPAARLDPAEVARQAADLLAARAPAPVPSQPEGRNQPDPVRDRERIELNNMMVHEFSDLMADTKLRSATLAKFRELAALPENRDRTMADIGRDAGAFIRNTMEGHPRQDRVEGKRAMIPPPVGARTAPVAPESQPKSPSSHIDRLRKAAGLPPNSR